MPQLLSMESRAGYRNHRDVMLQPLKLQALQPVLPNEHAAGARRLRNRGQPGSQQLEKSLHSKQDRAEPKVNT